MDMNSFMALEGTVTEFAFRNLHVQPASLTDSPIRAATERTVHSEPRMPQSRNLRAERSGAMLRNAESRYGAVTKLLHWSVAALILGLIWLGWYMVGLTYYDAWYNDSLAWHKALGIVVLALGALKIGWAFYSQPPAHAATLKRWERFAATVVHGLLYTMMVLIPVTGYLVASAASRTCTTSHSSSGASRSSGNSATCFDRDAPSTTSIERHHAARWLSLISPRYNTWRCTTRPPLTRTFSTTLQ